MFFMAVDAKASAAFIQHGDKYLADIYQLAGQRPAKRGVEQIFGGDRCTYTENETFLLIVATRPPVVWQVLFG
ncbi:hypothetical protein ACLK19_17355 [Escherichia coli]